jgi:hypothetical protein
VQPVIRPPAEVFSRRTAISANVPNLPLTLARPLSTPTWTKMAVFEGARGYRLRVPAGNFWCITIYDVSTRGLIDNRQLR